NAETGLGLRLDLLVSLARPDGDRPGPHTLGEVPNEVDVEQAVLEVGRLDLHVVGELEPALEGARRDPAVQEAPLAVLVLGFGLLLAADAERAFLHIDLDLI